MCLSMEEKKLIGSFNHMANTDSSKPCNYAINEIYCDANEVALFNQLVEKGFIFYGDNDFWWHLTEKGYAQWKAYNESLPYPTKGCG